MRKCTKVRKYYDHWFGLLGFVFTTPEKWDLFHRMEIHTSESDPRSYVVTEAVTNKAQKKF